MNARIFLRLFLCAAMLLAAPLAAARAAPLATTWVVTSLADAGPGTLREAMEQANANPGEDEILFGLDGAIALDTPLPAVAGALRIDTGGGGITLDGSGITYADELFGPMLTVPAGARLELHGLALVHSIGRALENGGEVVLIGCTFDGHDHWEGGAINNSGWMSIEDCVFTHNHSDTGGAIFNTRSGTLLLYRVLFVDNDLDWEGGAIYNLGTLQGDQVDFIANQNFGADFGGALANYGTARLSHSKFDSNGVNNGGGGAANSRVLTLEDVTFTRNGAKWGGAIVNLHNGTLEMHGGVFEDNVAGGHFGGGIENYGVARLDGVLFKDNWAVELCGALSNWEQAELQGVVFEDNRSNYGGAACNWNGAVMSISGSILRGNHADSDGGGIWNWGSLTLVQSTLSGNTALGAGGGLANMGAPYGRGQAGIHNVTISGNSAGYGGGVYNNGEVTASYVTLAYNGATGGGAMAGGAMAGGALANGPLGRLEIAASIAAYSPSGGNCSGLSPTGIYNLSDDTTCPAGFGVANPRLGALAGNGGVTPTHRLLAGSPAIDHDPNEACGAAVDQRGRPRPQGLGCDSGAYEFEQRPIAIDILPKTPVNQIDPRRPGQIAVALLSSQEFDAPGAVMWASLRFGKTGWEKSLYYKDKSNPACGVSDVNGDGLPDLVCSFVTLRSGLSCGDTRGVLRAQTQAGEWLFGTDRVVTTCTR